MPRLPDPPRVEVGSPPRIKANPPPPWPALETPVDREPSEAAPSASAAQIQASKPPDRHAADLFEANAEDREGRNWTYYNYGPFGTLADYRKWVEGSCADPIRMFHAIIDQASGAAVGVAAYANMQPAHGTIEVGALNFSLRLLVPLMVEMNAAEDYAGADIGVAMT